LCVFKPKFQNHVKILSNGKIWRIVPIEELWFAYRYFLQRSVYGNHGGVL
jgi:hypothetical protein